MSQKKPARKKVVVSTTNSTAQRAPRATKKGTADYQENLLFTKQNYILMGVGVGLIFLGLILMAGGNMPDPNIWDESIIYSPVRMVVAPILIISGFSVEIYAIFKRGSSSTVES